VLQRTGADTRAVGGSVDLTGLRDEVAEARALLRQKEGDMATLKTTVTKQQVNDRAVTLSGGMSWIGGLMLHQIDDLVLHTKLWIVPR
jgi:hypothetical protein